MTETSADPSANVQNLPVTIHAQYVKDISFENPNTPKSLRPGQDAPKMDISINLDAQPIEDAQVKNLYEVVLRLSARADRPDYPVFVAELQYAVTVSLPGVPENQHHPLLLIEVPKMAFPFARKVLADLTQEGGYPPLLIGPIDFYAMYMSRFGHQENQAATN